MARRSSRSTSPQREPVTKRQPNNCAATTNRGDRTGASDRSPDDRRIPLGNSAEAVITYCSAAVWPYVLLGLQGHLDQSPLAMAIFANVFALLLLLAGLILLTV